MILTEHEISSVCYQAYLRSKLQRGEKIGYVRGIQTIMKMNWYDKAKGKFIGKPKMWNPDEV